MRVPDILEAIAWDVDGTLIDSEPLHLNALLATCAAHGVDISDLPDDAFVGVSLHGVWEAIGSRYPANLDRARWVEEINAHYRSRCRAIPVDATVRCLVEQLARAGWRQVAVSNSNRAIVDANLSQLGLTGLFEFSLSLDDVARGKPDPEPYRRAADRLGLPPERMAVVEDSVSGLASARAAGCFVIALWDSPDPPAEADALVSKLEDVPSLLARADPGAGRTGHQQDHQPAQREEAS